MVCGGGGGRGGGRTEIYVIYQFYILTISDVNYIVKYII